MVRITAEVLRNLRVVWDDLGGVGRDAKTASLARLEPKHGGVAHRYLTNRYRAASTGVVEPVRKEYIGICEPHKAK